MTCAQARDWLATFLPLIADTPDDRELVVAPPFTAISTTAEVTSGSRLEISSQNVHWEAEGAFTGEIAPSMLEEHGVRYAIVGHSEPRKYFSESDEQINHRARSAQAHGLIPIVCVGESDEQRSRGEAERVIRRQVEQGLEKTLKSLNSLEIILFLGINKDLKPIWIFNKNRTKCPFLLTNSFATANCPCVNVDVAIEKRVLLHDVVDTLTARYKLFLTQCESNISK